MSSKRTAKGSRASAARTAASAFAPRPQSSSPADAPASSAAHTDRHRLDGAFQIAIHRIRPDPKQPRQTHDRAALAELTASVREHGILQPIAVRYSTADDVYYIIAGERRYQAALAVGLMELPCWVRNPDDAEILVHQIVENWQRADLHPFDLADALARLRDTGSHSQKDLAKLTGKSTGEISKLLSLLELDSGLQKELRADSTGTLSKRHLYEVRKLDANEQRPVVAAIREQRLTVEDTERLVAEKLGQRPSRRGKPVTKFEYVTTRARVLVTFRRQATSEDAMAALQEILDRSNGKDVTIRIVRPQSAKAPP